jgi:ABC-2 type transport system ATP-binding protein
VETVLIQAHGLCKSFGAHRAVDSLDLSIPAGEIYGLVGSDGAGKTTSIRLLVGALALDSGQVTICGHRLPAQIEAARSCIGYLSQRFSLYEELSVLENIRFFAEVRGLTRAEWLPRCNEILEFVGLAAFKDRRAGQLSGGMKQKLGLATALVTRPRVLLLDEPTTGVDPVTRQDFWQLLLRLVAGNDRPPVAVLISTPYMDEAARCHQVGFLKNGRLIAEGAPRALRVPLEGRILELTGDPLPVIKPLAARDPAVEDVRAFGDRLHLRIQPGQAQVVTGRLAQAIQQHKARLLGIRPILPSLEDVFIDLAGDGEPFDITRKE